MINFVDSTVISVFWAIKNQEVDPVPALLDDVYYTLNICHDKKIRSLHCCIPLLYQWIVSHLYKDIYMIEAMSNHNWAQKTMSLTKRLILWYPQGNNCQLRKFS